MWMAKLSTANALQLRLIYAFERHEGKPVARIQATGVFLRKIEELKTEGYQKPSGMCLRLQYNK